MGQQVSFCSNFVIKNLQQVIDDENSNKDKQKPKIQ